ncbi:insulinase family protein [Candidatus Nomurabacteria bacterium]|nr:insulinase family protein [Candidatus Nomurabacteria bacterium]USN94595.1 MAG: insulinase family protein [Candidatus Nomurabacteria bacterium]
MKIIKKKLKNGVEVVLSPMLDNPTVTFVVLVKTGSRNETKQNSGISHFLEHMCFKGTEKRLSAHDISSELDGIGAQSNAFTSHEYTGYYAKSDKKYSKKILDVVSDIYLNPTLPEKEIEKEKGVILEEINMYEDMPQQVAIRMFYEVLYGDTSLGWSILGPKENIKKFKREDFLKYKEANYLPENTSIIVAGNFDKDQVFSDIKNLFEKIPTKKTKRNKPIIKDTQTSPTLSIKEKKTDQTHFVLGVRTFEYENKKNPTLEVLRAVLGGGMSSRLFQKLREEMGVCYYVKAGTDIMTDRGFLAISSGSDNKRVKNVVRVCLDECSRLAEGDIDEKELKKAKAYVAGNLSMGLESSDDVAMFIGEQQILSKSGFKTPAEIKKEIEKVEIKDVVTLAKQIFKKKNLNLSVVGPWKDKKDFSKELFFRHEK